MAKMLKTAIYNYNSAFYNNSSNLDNIQTSSFNHCNSCKNLYKKIAFDSFIAFINPQLRELQRFQGKRLSNSSDDGEQLLKVISSKFKLKILCEKNAHIFGHTKENNSNFG